MTKGYQRGKGDMKRNDCQMKKENADCDRYNNDAPNLSSIAARMRQKEGDQNHSSRNAIKCVHILPNDRQSIIL